MKTVRAWEIWRNPLVLRYWRSRMRPATAGAWLLATLLLTSFIVLGIYLGSVQQDALAPWQAARATLVPLLVIQGFILMLLGTGAVAGGITQEKVEGVLEYQRLTPMSRGAKIVGYFFGLPIREYAMFAVTLPFTAFAIIRGDVPLKPVLTIYLVFFSSAWLYHMTGMAAGMVSRRWRRAARLSQALVVALYLFLPQLSQFGLVFLEYLTVRPVAISKLGPIMAEMGQDVGSHLPAFMRIEEAPLFGLSIPIALFSLLVQGLLLLTFVIMVRRKWKADAANPLGKPYALFFFGAILLLVTGNAWGGKLTIFAPLALPIAFALLSLVLAILLLGMVTPPLNTWRKGLRAAFRKGHSQLGLLQDEQMALTVAAAFAGGSAALCGFLLSEAEVTGAQLLQLPLALLVAIVSWQVGREWLGKRSQAFVALCLWLLPVLLAIIITAASDALVQQSYYVAALSPLGTVLEACGNLVASEQDLASPARAAWTGIVLHAVLIAIAGFPLMQQRKRVRNAELEMRQAPEREVVAV